MSAALEYNALIEGGKIPQEMLGGHHPLCMSQYNKIFGTHRVPKIPKDDLLFQDPKNPSRNIIVMYNNHVSGLFLFKIFLFFAKISVFFRFIVYLLLKTEVADL